MARGPQPQVAQTPVELLGLVRQELVEVAELEAELVGVAMMEEEQA